MTIRLYNHGINFVRDSDNDKDIELQIESDGLKFTGTLTTAFNVAYSAPPQAPLNTAFVSGGGAPASPFLTSIIEKYPFAISSGTATDTGGDLAAANRPGRHSASSPTDGFVLGGDDGTIPKTSQIEKFPFSISSGSATDVGDLNQARSGGSGHQSTDAAFAAGGSYSYSTESAIIDKVPFVQTSGTATNVGSLQNAGYRHTGYSDPINQNGLVVSGSRDTPTPYYLTSIRKFPFAITSGTTSDTGGNLSKHIQNASNVQSTTTGFVAGGQTYSPPMPTPSPINDIHKFPFAIGSGTATDIADLNLATRAYMAGSNSPTAGFLAGGLSPPASPTNLSDIQKLPFAISSGTTSSTGDLTVGKYSAGGHQN